MSTPRIQPANAPFPQSVETFFERLAVQGVAPLTLFTTLARDERLFQRFISGGMLDRGNISMRLREIIITRTTAQNGSEYEWGVHMALFNDLAGLTEDQAASVVHGGPDDACWDDEMERTLIRITDAVNETADLTDNQWASARAFFSEEAMIEILMLCGYYRLVARLTNALRLPLEDFAHRFPPTEQGPAA